ncbi:MULTISPECIES: FAD-dependent oxidoreductase [unclassified Pseudarthrobacter]|uniref:FAD-dependent oxidoreductase n=1 Tax=unclassified Pseudarthrobacter TaxID=2647000 RepID=UPI0030785F1F
MTDVAVVGGGPVGLYLAALLLQEGVGVRVLEQRSERDRHSRAIGIHPPALAALERAGVARALVADGVPIRRGRAYSGGKLVGTMSFESVSRDFPFVLSLPQCSTEAHLERRVQDLDPTALARGARVTGITDDGDRLALAVTSGGASTQLASALAVAADGTHSTVRQLLGIPVTARRYPDHYVMGDFADAGIFGTDAVLFLEEGGIVESFPLPGGLRRWVVRIGEPRTASAADLASLVQERTGIGLDAGSSTMLSSFSVRSALARSMVAGRTVLIGDAAHEVSPIGGQGMNLGWLDGEALAPIICGAMAGGPVERRLRDFEVLRRRAAGIARRQSEVNMMLGRPLTGPWLRLRNFAMGAVASVQPLNRAVARRFTMQ